MSTLKNARTAALLALVLAACMFYPRQQLAAAQHAPSLSGNWVRITTAVSPTARSGMAMAYDPISKEVVLFGGFSASGYLDDTWTFDGKTRSWTQQHPATAPPVRTAGNMAYDAVSHQLVLFGGYNGSTYLGDTWTWDGASSTWTQQNPAHPPVAVTGPSLFTDPLNGHADNFGGYDGFLYQLHTYQWTGSDWQLLQPKTTPGARGAAAAGLNAADHYVVLFGGLADINPNNTWEWNGTNWIEESPAQQPVLLYDAGTAYDSMLKQVVLFGGGSGGVDQNQTWEWTGSTWVTIVTPTTPAPRELHGMTFDQQGARIVMFGGQDGGTFLNDTWVFVAKP